MAYAPTKALTIYQALADKLGREPTRAELHDECKRIIRDAHNKVAEQGRLPYQRKR